MVGRRGQVTSMYPSDWAYNPILARKHYNSMVCGAHLKPKQDA